MVSVVKRHVEAHSTRGLGVGRVGPGQRSFEPKHDAACSLRYCCVPARIFTKRCKFRCFDASMRWNTVLNHGVMASQGATD